MDKTGTLTQGVFEVTAVHHNSMNEDKLIGLTALAESASSHPISKSLQKAHGKNLIAAASAMYANWPAKALLPPLTDMK